MPTEEWDIIYYESLSGDVPVYNFIENLSPIAKSKVANTFDLLTEYGIKLGLPHVKKLTGTELWELRILGGGSIRILYIAISGKNFLLLHGFKKKKDRTPTKEIRVAEDRLAEFRSRP